MLVRSSNMSVIFLLSIGFEELYFCYSELEDY